MAQREFQPAISTPHPLATEAGLAVLARGGTAAEAVVAAGAVLTVVCPHFCGIGGDAVWMLADAQGRRQSLLAIGQGIERAPLQGPAPLRGPGSVLTTAALADGWEAALTWSARHWGGRAALADLLAPAVALARDGFAVTPSQVFWTEYRAEEARSWPGFAAQFLPGGAPPVAGEILRQPGLAASLSRIAEEGAVALRQGPLAEAVVEGLRAAGCVIALSDLAATRARFAEPLTVAAGGRMLLAPPPPTQGVTTLTILALLDRLGASGAAGGADHLHLCVEAVKQAFLERHDLGDPAFGAPDGREKLDPARLEAAAARVRRDQALPWPEPYRHGDTVWLGALDAAGNAASVLQSTYFDWGSGVIAGETGILWQNRGAAFSHLAGHPNVFAPGKLPFYTLNPGLALRDGVPEILYGTQGADGQPQTLAVLLSSLLFYGATPQQALRQPRFLLGRTFSDSRDSLKIEADAGEAVLAELAARGHLLAPIAAQSPIAGLAGLIMAGPEGSYAGHDPRGEGTGAVLPR